MLAPGREVMVALCGLRQRHRRMKVDDREKKPQIERRFDAFDRSAFDGDRSVRGI
jgi:hypothetical protein